VASPRLTSFQRLALWTTAVTYLLILVGGLVRASGAGLGCPDWPRCFGSWVPPSSVDALPPEFDPADFNPTLMWTEYLNRLLGVTVGFSVLATTISAWRHHRRDPHIFWPVVAALLLTGYEGWLGGRVVAHELAPWIVTVHLVVALVIVSLLLYATVYTFFSRNGAPPRVHGGRRLLVTATAVVIALTLVQVAIGTQVRGNVDDALDHGTPRAEALATVGALDTWHRDLSLVVLSGMLVLFLIVRSRHAHERPLTLTTDIGVGLTAAQIGIGLILVYGALPPPAQVSHLFVGSLLLGDQTVLLLLGRWLTPNTP
jgi:cytochrome c oxidase assembly protein subunit 15